MTKTIPFAAILIATLAAGRTAVASWLPFRIAFADSYVDEDVYRNEASDIYGFRLGLFEAVNHDVYGFSVSVVSDGGFSLDGGRRQFVDNDFGGFKVGGLCTSFSGSGLGFQLAGLWNIGGDMAGFQIAGISSQAAFMRGFQIAGLYACADMEMFGFQIGGLVAEVGADGADEVPAGGLQIGGLVALCDGNGSSFSGFQIGGLYAGCGGSFHGVQIGCITHAGDLHGLQIGVINDADSLHGVQIGAINISGTSKDGNLRGLPVVNWGF